MTAAPSRVPVVTVYGVLHDARHTVGGFPCRDLPIAEALAFAEQQPRGPVTLMLGGMRPGYRGRELVTVDDLRRWVAEDTGTDKDTRSVTSDTGRVTGRDTGRWRTLLPVTLLVVAVAWVAAPVTATGHDGPDTVPTRPCLLEDGPGPCFWDAGRRGNHRGYSYWLDRSNHIHYLDPRKGR